MSKEDDIKKGQNKIDNVEEHLNRIANIGVEGGALAIHEWMDNNKHKNPYVRLASLTGSLLAMIPREVLAEHSAWDSETVSEALSLLYAGISADLEVESREDIVKNIVEALEKITEGKGASCGVIPIKLKKGESIEDFLDEKLGKRGYKRSDIEEEVWTNVKSGPESTN